MLYRLDASATDIAGYFGARAGEDPWEGGMISPGRFAPVITSGREFIAGPRPDEEQPRRLVPRLWGVPPPPSAGDAGRAVLTVRNLESPFWIGNLRNSEFRCLVPASGFAEWGRDDQATGKRRQYWISFADQPIFALAGVWKDSEVPSFALLTCDANMALREQGIERMPVVLPMASSAWATWLSSGWDQAKGYILPYPTSMTGVS